MKKIKNAVIFTMSGEPIENGVIIYDDKIRYVGKDTNEFEITNEIDAAGMYLFPGLIDAHCHVGMFEDSLGFEGDDGNEESDPITPQMRAIDALNPFDRSFRDAVGQALPLLLPVRGVQTR